MHVFHFQKHLADTFDNLPSELICFLGATDSDEIERDDIIILTLQLPSSRRGKKLKNIPQTLYNCLLSVPYWINESNVVGVHVQKRSYITFKEGDGM